MCVKGNHSEALAVCHCTLRTPITLHSQEDASPPFRASKRCCWVHCTCNSAWKKSLEETVGSICKGHLMLPNLLDTTELHCLLSSVLKNSCFAYFLQFFSCLVHTGKSGSYYCILADSKNFACLINSCPLKTVGISCSPVSIWRLHICFFCSSLSLP